MAQHRDKIKPLRPIDLKKIKALDEFKQFILRGNVIDLAVGVIIGGAFNKIVTSLVNDVIMPLLSVIIGQNRFDSLYIALNGGTYDSLVKAAEAEAPLLKYGSFLATVLDFLLMGVVIFCLVKGIAFVRGKLTKETDKPAAPATKECPHCISNIHLNARVCPHCTREV